MELSGAIRSYNINIGNLALQICDLPAISDSRPVPEGFHTHFYYELFFSIHGKAIIEFEDASVELKPGEICVIPPTFPHYSRVTEKDGNENAQYASYCFVYDRINTGEDVYQTFDAIFKDKKRYFLIRYCAFAYEQLCTIEQEKGRRDSLTVLKHSSALYLVVLEIIRSLMPHTPDKQYTKNDDISSRNYIIEDFFSLNYPHRVTVNDLAKRMNLSAKQANRIIFEIYGKSFQEKLTEVRIQVAKNILGFTDIPISAVAELCGYQSHSGFYEIFREKVKMSPYAYRKNHKQNGDDDT